MMEDPRTISASIEILFISKAIERIGDHSKNISEYVVYMVKGKDVRHVSVEEIEREIMA
jgi:phosphate transport system protein